MNIITCAGYGATGSSAITDYVSEFNNVHSLGATVEFQLLSEPDGIYTLEKALTSGNQLWADLAISRFKIFFEEFKKRFGNLLINKQLNNLLDEYLKNLDVISWYGGWYGSQQDEKDEIFRSFSKAIFDREMKKNFYCLYEPETTPWKPSYYPGYTQNFAYCSKEQFRTSTKKFINSIFNEILNIKDAENLMVDHLVPPMGGMDYSEYVENLKVIVVDSNPVDLYLKNTLVWGERWIPYENVDIFINWYRQSRLHRKIEKNNPNYLFIQFESLIYDYENTSKKINTFLNLSEDDHEKKCQYFDPNKSIKNTNLEQKFELTDNLKADIQKIKSELQEYLFDFPSIIVDKKIKTYPVYLIREKSDIAVRERKISISLFPKAIYLYIKNQFYSYIKSYFRISTKAELKQFLKNNIVKAILKILFLPILLIKDGFSKIIDLILLK